MTGGRDLSSSTKLAVDRTWLAHERTMMAWVRTAASLISFGFTIYKFFQFLNGDRPLPDTLLGPRGFAIVLIGIGLLSLVLAAIENRRDLRRMRAEFGPQPRSLAVPVAMLVGLVGILGLILVMLRR